jgi:AAA domain
MSSPKTNPSPNPTVLSLAQLLEQPPATPPCLLEPGVLPTQGILFVGGEPKVGKSLLVANLALCLAAGSNRLGFPIPVARRVLICQFELPLPQFVSRLLIMRRALGSAADHHLLIDTRASGHLLSAPQGLNHFLVAAQAAAAEVIVLDPLYSTHDQDENDTRAMAALCQSLLRLRDVSRAALIVVHHVRKSIGREEIGSAFRGSSALHAVGDSYLLLTRPSPQLPTVELRFQFRYAAPQPPQLLELNPQTLWFSPVGSPPAKAAPGRKVETSNVSQALAQRGGPLRYNQLRHEIMQAASCSKRTAQLAISQAAQQGRIVHKDGQHHLPYTGAETGDVAQGCCRLEARSGFLWKIREPNEMLRSRQRTTRPGETEAGNAGVQPAEG